MELAVNQKSPHMYRSLCNACCHVRDELFSMTRRLSKTQTSSPDGWLYAFCVTPESRGTGNVH